MNDEVPNDEGMTNSEARKESVRHLRPVQRFGHSSFVIRYLRQSLYAKWRCPTRTAAEIAVLWFAKPQAVILKT